MSEYSAITAPVMAFYSKPFYRAQALNGKGLGFLYLFLLLLLCWTPVSVRVYMATDTGCRSKELAEFIDQIPTMTWSNSKLSIDKACPYAISEQGKPIIVFDTSGKMTSLKDAAPARTLLTADAAFTEKTGGTEETVPWKQFMTDYKLGPDSIKEFLGKIPLWLGVAVWLLGIFVWIGHILVALILGGIGLLMDQKKLGYATAVRLASFAMTPAVILSTVRELTQLNIPGWGFLTLGISLAFLFLAYSSVNQDA